MIELMTNTIKEDINNIRKTVDDLKASLNFSQKDIDDIKYKLYITEEKVWDAEDAIYGNQSAIDKLFDQNEQLENHSRRNNVKVIGIPEKDPNESWEESENLVKNAIKEHLNIEEDVMIERAHRVGRSRPSDRHDWSKVKPRPIVARFQFWKQKDHVIRAARKSKPKNIKFYEDFAKATLDRRRERIPELIQRRKDGQRVFLVMDKIVHARSKPPDSGADEPV